MTTHRRYALASISLLLLLVAACTAAPTPTPTAEAAPADPGAGDPWAATAAEYRANIGEHYEYDCPPDGTPHIVWGTDIYTDDSSVCTAAVHLGEITLEDGGTVTIEMAEGRDSYDGTERNGIETSDYGQWGGSFVFVLETD
jgi:hypothetical protein